MLNEIDFFPGKKKKKKGEGGEKQKAVYSNSGLYSPAKYFLFAINIKNRVHVNLLLTETKLHVGESKTSSL